MRKPVWILVALLAVTSDAWAQERRPQVPQKPLPASPAQQINPAKLNLDACGVWQGTELMRRPGLGMPSAPAIIYAGAGSGPVPDITDWRPRTRVERNTEVVIQGRNLNPSQLVAMLGAVQLTQTGQSPGEVRFRAPAQAQPGAALAVYYRGGQVRTLETEYQVFDPTVIISKVVPAAFSQGDVVTVCGSNLFQAFLGDSYTEIRQTQVVLNVSQLQLKPGNFIAVGSKKIEARNMSISASGDRIVFTAGDPYETYTACLNSPQINCSTQQGVTFYLNPLPQPYQPISGALTIPLKGVRQVAQGPSVTWQAGGPRISAVYGRTFGVKEPFVILPSPSAPMLLAQGYVDGANLDNVSWKIGAMPIGGGTRGPGMPTDGTYAILSIPLNASNGPVCGTLNGKTACGPVPLQVFGAPEITSMPAMPLALRVNQTIEGINLQPPAIPGLTYRFTMFGTESSSTTTACNLVMEVIQHTANRIVFRIGDPAKTAPVPAGCNQGAMFTAPVPGSPRDYNMYIFASYTGMVGGGQGVIKPIPFYVKP
jgi:hypothetical protein